MGEGMFFADSILWDKSSALVVDHACHNSVPVIMPFRHIM